VISTVENSSVTEVDRRAMDKLAAVVLFTSQGIPFIQAGQEFLRTKGGDHNSYDKPDAVNMIRWRMKAEHYDVYEYYRGLIALRLAHTFFRLETADEVLKSVKFLDDHLGMMVPPGCLAWMIEDHYERDEWERALVLVNTQTKAAEFEIPPGTWRIFVDSKRAGKIEIRDSIAIVEEHRAIIAQRSAVILAESRKPGDSR
jgi:pullulanase